MSSKKGIHSSREIINFYSDRASNFGNSSKGVGWKNDHAQLTRFDQLAKVFFKKNNFSLNDLGCGTGRLYQYLLAKKYKPTAYHGYDILDEMLDLAKTNLLPDKCVTLSKIKTSAEMSIADYTVASGIFNVKYDANEEEWLNHILATLQDMNNQSRLGFAFNLLTKYSDKELMQPYLYYADPLVIFDFCKKNFSKNVALLHDYFLYDFTVIVRKQPLVD